MRLGYTVCSSAVHMDLLSGSVFPENVDLAGNLCPEILVPWPGILGSITLHMDNSSSWRLPSAMVPVRRTHYTSGFSVPAHFLVVESLDCARGAASFSYSW